MPIIIHPIASGSKGNSTCVTDGKTHLLIDAGVSIKKTEQKLSEIGLKISDVSAILITHEHIDHVSNLKTFALNFGMPIYATAGTIGAILGMPKFEDFEESFFETIQADNSITIGSFTIIPFNISHDVAEPVAYRFDTEDESAAIVTDIGRYDRYTIEHLKSLDTLMIEANHDVCMVEAGPYPYYLKQRVLSDKGHLSNDMCAKLVAEVVSEHTRSIILAHLSEKNNYPSLAYETVRTELLMSGFETNNIKITLA